jgi:hypothetical protein
MKRLLVLPIIAVLMLSADAFAKEYATFTTLHTTNGSVVAVPKTATDSDAVYAIQDFQYMVIQSPATPAENSPKKSIVKADEEIQTVKKTTPVSRHPHLNESQK